MDAHSLCNGCGERTGTPVQCRGDCAHVQRELKLFDEIYKDNSSAVQLRDPGIIACVKVEDTVFVSSENVESCRVQTTSQKKTKKPYTKKQTDGPIKAT